MPSVSRGFRPNLLSVIIHCVNRSLMLRVCNLWKFKHYLFVFVFFLIYCVRSWSCLLSINLVIKADYRLFISNVQISKHGRVTNWKTVINRRLIKSTIVLLCLPYVCCIHGHFLQNSVTRSLIIFTHLFFKHFFSNFFKIVFFRNRGKPIL